jgi:uncharacterized protein with HEPN domain
MSFQQRDAAWLHDMLKYATPAVRSSRGLTRSHLSSADPTTAAVERWITIIGEAARNVSIEFRKDHPQIPWVKIIATRNILAHEYGQIDYDIVWRILTVHLPVLVDQLATLVPQPPPDPVP